MKKLLILMISLCNIFSVIAMQQHKLVITQEESTNFARHLQMAVGFGEKVIAENKVSNNNPIQFMLKDLSNKLSQKENDIRKLIFSDEQLVNDIQEYQKIDNDPLVKVALDQVSKKVGNTEEAKKFITRFRVLSSDSKLFEKYSNYSRPWIGEVQKEERINFMLRNSNYEVTHTSMQDYLTLFIYQLIFAQKFD